MCLINLRFMNFGIMVFGKAYNQQAFTFDPFVCLLLFVKLKLSNRRICWNKGEYVYSLMLEIDGLISTSCAS